MLISILITILGIFFLLAFESFFVTLLSFSVFIIVILVLIDKWDWKKWVIFTLIISIFLDIVLHREMGTTLLIGSLSSMVLYLFFLIMPKKQVILSYLPYFFAIFIFYLLLQLFTPLIQDSVWGNLSWSFLLGAFIKSVISTLIIFLTNTVISNFRSDSQLTL